MARIGSAAFTPPVRSRLRRLKVSYWRERLFTGGVNAALPIGASYWRERLFTGGVNAALPIGAQDKMPKNYPKEITRRKITQRKITQRKITRKKLLVRNYPKEITRRKIPEGKSPKH